MELPIAGIAAWWRNVPLYYAIPALALAPPVLLVTVLVTYVSIVIPLRLFKEYVLHNATYRNVPAPRHASRWFPL